MERGKQVVAETGGIANDYFIDPSPSYFRSTDSFWFTMAHRDFVIRNLNDTFKHLETDESTPASARHNSYTDFDRFQRMTTIIPSSAMVHSANQWLLPPPAPSVEEASSSTTSTGESFISRNTSPADAYGKVPLKFSNVLSNFCISNSLHFPPGGLTDSKSLLVQVMARHRAEDSPVPEAIVN